MTLLEDSIRKVRKPHRCVWCGERIEPGETAHHQTLIFDGFQSNYWHPECYGAALNADFLDGDEDFDEGMFVRGTADER